MTSTDTPQVILGAHFPGVNSTTVWSDPRSGSHIAFDSFVRFARAAERGHLDFLFLAEGLRLREHRGLIHDLDVVGRPDTLPVLAALAGVTEHVGLVGTINTTFNEPYELARQFGTLDHLSGGRAAWNVVTSSDAFTGENFRRGGYLEHGQRYERAADVLEAARTIWDAWPADELLADAEGGRFVAGQDTGAFEVDSDHVGIHGHAGLPRPPQGHPVILQAGDSPDGRDFAARSADAIFTFLRDREQGRAFRRDISARLASYGRRPDELKVLPGATFVLGESEEDARQRAAEIRLQQVSGQTALLLLENIWNRDLSGYDPDGPVPDVDPDPGPSTVVQGRVRHAKDPFAEVARLRALAEENGLSLREVAVEISGRATFVGTPATIADEIVGTVAAGAADGFILVPHITPGGLDDFVDHVVPLLVERGALRSSYPAGATLRDLLGIPGARSADQRAHVAGLQHRETA